MFASDICKDSQQVYYNNYGMKPVGDIKEIASSEIPHHDILCGGFPCQAFSQLGNNLGVADIKKGGDLFYEIVRILHDKQPPCFILENVRGLLAPKHLLVFDSMIQDLEYENYSVFYKVLNSKDYGLPQSRNRLFIVGFHSKLNVTEFEFPNEVESTLTLSDVINQDCVREYSRTIRTSGRGMPLDSRHCWDNVLLNDGSVYQYTREDCKLLQGFPKEFKLLEGNKITANFKLLGNTIPTCLTYAVGERVRDVLLR